jgi:hypothetical protein
MKKRILIFCILATPLFMVLARIDLFPYPFGSPYSDLTISHLPNLEFIRDSLVNHQQIPLWNPHLFAGYPFSANPLASLWYLPSWLALVFPSPMGVNLLVALHMFWGGIGVYYFLLDYQVSEFSSLLGALIWELLPKTFSHYAMGHITLIFAVSWTGWLLLTTKKSLEKNAPWKRLLLPGLIFGMIMLADVRWVAVAGIFWIAYILFLGFSTRREGASVFGFWKEYIYKACIWIGIGLMIASALLLPLIQYIGLSTRSELSIKDTTMLSLDPLRVIGFLVPDMAGVGEWMLYCGGLLVPILAWGIWAEGYKKERLFFGIMTLFGLVVSMGENIPGFAFFFGLPGINLLRVPSRFLFLVGFCLVVILAMNVDLMLSGLIRKKEQVVGARLSITLVMMFVAFLCTGIIILTKRLPFEFIWSGVIIFSGVLVLLFYEYHIIEPVALRLIIIAIFVFDLCVVNDTQLSFIRVSDVEETENDILNRLPVNAEQYRIYSPSYLVGQFTPLTRGMDMASGIDPLQLKIYANFLQSAGGFIDNGYDVTLPPLNSDAINESNKNAQTNPYLLGLLNVKFIISGSPINNPKLQLIELVNNAYVYENLLVRSRAWIEEGADKVNFKAAKIVFYSPNRVVISAQGPGRLVLADENYPGWIVKINDHRANLGTAYQIFRSVELVDGTQTVEFVYLPILQYFGLVISFLAWLLVLVSVVKNDQSK